MPAWQWEKLDAEGTQHRSLVWKLNDKLLRLAHFLKPFDGLIGPNGQVWIGDAANANNTFGLTINQLAADDHILTLKSSDVAHGMTTGATPNVETDDFATFSKASATLGGLEVQVLAEDAAIQNVLLLQAIGGTPDTTKSTSGRALIEVHAVEHNGANTSTDIGADGNVFAVRCRRGGADVALMIVDEDGDLWLGGGLAIGLGAITSGTYTPTLTNVTNVAASTAYSCQYMRVGSVVTVSGIVDVDPTATGQTQLGISLPIASALPSAVTDVAGVAFSHQVAGQGAAIRPDAVNDRALMEWVASDLSNRSMLFTFTYVVV